MEPWDYQTHADKLLAILAPSVPFDVEAGMRRLADDLNHSEDALAGADRAAVLREAADDLEAWEPEPSERWTEAERNRYEDGVDAAADRLRRLAAEAPDVPVEHCTHDIAVHQRFHRVPVDGCPWCAEPAEPAKPAPGMQDVPVTGEAL